MHVTIIEQPEMYLIGLSYAGPFQSLSVGVPQTAKAFRQRLEEIPNPIDPLTRYELSIEDPNDTYTLYIGAKVDAYQKIPAGMVGYTVPALTYAQVVHEGPLQEVPNTYVQLFKWIDQEGYQRATEFHSIERYHRDTEANTVSILIPIRKDTL